MWLQVAAEGFRAEAQGCWAWWRWALEAGRPAPLPENAVCITWELASNSDSQASAPIYWIRICILSRPPKWSACTLKLKAMDQQALAAPRWDITETWTWMTASRTEGEKRECLLCCQWEVTLFQGLMTQSGETPLIFSHKLSSLTSLLIHHYTLLTPSHYSQPRGSGLLPSLTPLNSTSMFKDKVNMMLPRMDAPLNSCPRLLPLP